MYHRNFIVLVVVATTILSRYQYNCNELPPKDMHTRLSSRPLDSTSTPRDQANFHHYRRSDQHTIRTGDLHQAPLNSIPKSDKYQGWKPIISSRSLPSRYDSIQKLRQSNESESYSRNSNSIATEAGTTAKPIQRAPLSIQRQAPSRTPATHQTTDKIVKEDAIMWMHYGGQVDDNSSSSTEPAIKSGEEKFESKNPYHSQYRLDLDQSIRENPKNIYEIMDKNSPPTFKPIAESRQDTSNWQRNFDKLPSTEATRPSSDDSLWLDLYNTVYHQPDIRTEHQAFVENESHENDIYDFRNNEQIVNLERSRSQSHLPSLVDDKKSPQHQQSPHPTRAYTTESDLLQGQSYKALGTEKGGKFLGKPIVIAEQSEPDSFPYFTAEYYRKLFDSFGRYDRSLDESSLQSKPFPNAKIANQTDSNKTAAFPATTSCSSDDQTAACKTNTTRNDQSSHKPHHNKYHFNVFKFIGIDMKDFMPKTLRTNIYLIKKLLTECYTELHDQDPSPIVCLKKVTIKILDKAVDSPVIKLTDNVSLVKENVTSLVTQERSNSANTEWLPDIVDKMTRLFSTHSLRVQLVNSQDDGKHQVEGRRRHYRRVFPIVVGAYMILSTVLIPLGFKFMTLLGTKSLLLSKLSLMISLMGGLKKLFGYGTESIVHSYYTPTYYPTAAYPQAYPTYYDPWRRDEFRKISHYDDPVIDYSHFSEEVE